MKLKDKELWLELYDVAEKIQKLEPWKHLWDMDLLVYISESLKDVFYCSIFGHAGMHKAVAIYQGEQVCNFLNLAESEIPANLIFNYQECLMCNFSERERTLPKNREIIKELGLSFRGTWISFENIEKGYAPSPVNMHQVKIMIDVLQNVYMMLIAIIQHGLEVNFDEGQVLQRHYDKEKKLYINFASPLIIAKKHYGIIKVNDEFEKTVMKIPQTEMEIEYEFLNFLPIKIRELQEQDGRYYYPISRIMAERNSGFIILQNILDKNGYKNKDEYVIDCIDLLIEKIHEIGRPKTIYVRDEETKMYLKDVADKAKIKIVINQNLEAIDSAYNALSRMGI